MFTELLFDAIKEWLATAKKVVVVWEYECRNSAMIGRSNRHGIAVNHAIGPFSHLISQWLEIINTILETKAMVVYWHSKQWIARRVDLLMLVIYLYRPQMCEAIDG